MPSVDSPVFMDACNSASGVFYNGDWLYTCFNLNWPEIADLHINYKEVLSIYIAARRWAPAWANSSVTVFTDNTTACAIINKGTCRNPLVMSFLRALFWMAAINNFSIHAVYMRGPSNILADSISRLHEHGQFMRLEFLLWEWVHSHGFDTNIFILPHHISPTTLFFLHPQILDFYQSRTLTQQWQNIKQLRLPVVPKQPIGLT